ncbi:hypothetical protein RB614_00950 [Phytohabitans sp. ZYX-F-186]|uniref:Helicase HerA central domain-containing protein n=1 Tax=Phytohabitans maris TaxID=3071409 RepID=A0ABU0Z7R8_9ACTN|nr:DUF87 domain-containing protein [Phytohabitans sp. ZYX-F-186]MDQ7903088.1 hypothetical protein [Phytohabitans sp. ZYX-F-186]
MTTAVLLLVVGLGLVSIVLAARWMDAASWRQTLVAVELHLPYGLTPDDVGRWLNTVAAATHPHRWSLLSYPPLVLEAVADHDGIRHLLLAPKRLRETVLSGLRAALPGVRLTDVPGYLDTRPALTVAAEAAQTNQRRQMAVDRAEATATAVLATLQPVDPGETIVVQWIITGAGTPPPIPSLARQQHDLPEWLAAEELTDGDAIRSARLKDKDAALYACLRVGVRADQLARAYAILGRVWGQHRGENAPGVLILRRWWLPMRWGVSRLSRLAVPVIGWPLLVSTREAAGLLPIPVGEVALPGIALGLARQLPPPPGMPTLGIQLGVSNYPDLRVPLRLTDADRLAHLHVLGPTGTGKSTLLANIILQDIAAGHGVVVIDPKSDLVASILDRVPEDRANDIIVADAASTVRPVGFNILRSAHDEQGRELVVDNVIHIWHEIYKDFWGPRSEDVLRGALLSLINTKGANGEPFTLIETPELLTANPFRKFVTEQDGVPAGLASFWSWYRGMIPAERIKVIGPILNKLRAATLRTPIRLMLGQAEGIDLDRVLAQRRVLLVPLSGGTLGAETAGLLGTMLLAALWQAVLGRVALPASERHTMLVHVDEAQSVLKLPVDLADMLAQARGLGVGFTLAHQHLGQIEDKQVKSALLGTVRSQIVFQAMRDDAATLAPSYAPRLTADDLMGLSRYEFAMRPLVDGQTLAPLTGTTLPLPPSIRDGAALAEASRQRHGRPRAEIEAALKARGRAPEDPEPKTAADGGKAKPAKGQPFGRRRKPGKPEGGES